jgi:hypothetical protein
LGLKKNDNCYVDLRGPAFYTEKNNIGFRDTCHFSQEKYQNIKYQHFVQKIIIILVSATLAIFVRKVVRIAENNHHFMDSTYVVGFELKKTPNDDKKSALH